MRRSAAALLSSAAVGLAALSASRPSFQRSWTLPLETDVSSRPEQQLPTGDSPKPTSPPLPRGRFDLMARQDTRSPMGPDTCGYLDENRGPMACSADQTCTTFSDFIGCCNTESACPKPRNACLNYDGGKCNPGKNKGVYCCASDAEFCNTHVYNNLGLGTRTLTLVGCNTFKKDALLSVINPILTPSQSLSSSTQSSSSGSGTSTVSTPKETATDPDRSGGGQTNVGAIVGGVLGGLAILGLAAVATLLLLRHRKDRGSDAQHSPPAAHIQPSGLGPYAAVPQSNDTRTSTYSQPVFSGQGGEDRGQYFAKPPGQGTLATPETSPQATPSPGAHGQHGMSELAATPPRGNQGYPAALR